MAATGTLGMAAKDGCRRKHLLEEGALEGVAGGGFAEVLVGEGGGFATAGGALDEAFLDEVRLVDILDGAGVFAEGGGDVGEAYGTSIELVDDGGEELVVDLVEAVLIDAEGFEGVFGNLDVDGVFAHHHREVTNAAQQGVGDTRCATTAEGYFDGGFLHTCHAQDARRTCDDAGKHFGVIVFEVHVDAEACAQRSREQARTCGSTDEGERVEVDLDAAGSGTLVDEDVDAVVFHR